MFMMIGSKALEQLGIETGRASHDIDFIAHKESIPYLVAKYPDRVAKVSDDGNHIYLFPKVGEQPIIEIEVAWPGSTGDELLKLRYSYNHCDMIDILYTLKMSHRFKKNSRFFQKTMDDILLMRKHGAKIPDYLKDWFKRREKETLNYKHPKLQGVGSKKFFQDSGIEYKYMHDDIHEAVKHLEKPAYTYYLSGSEQVHCSKDAFFEVSEEIRLYGVLEESYVLSLERSIIPFNVTDVDNQYTAFTTALEKVCTSITSGWFREYAWENYHKVKSMYNRDYIQRFDNAVYDGKVRLYEH